MPNSNPNTKEKVAEKKVSGNSELKPYDGLGAVLLHVRRERSATVRGGLRSANA